MIDQRTEEVVWTVATREGVRPMNFETNADGSTKRIFVQLSGFNGFVPIDFATHALGAEVKLPDRISPSDVSRMTPEQKKALVEREFGKGAGSGGFFRS